MPEANPEIEGEKIRRPDGTKLAAEPTVAVEPAVEGKKIRWHDGSKLEVAPAIEGRKPRRHDEGKLAVTVGRVTEGKMSRCGPAIIGKHQATNQSLKSIHVEVAFSVKADADGVSRDVMLGGAPLFRFLEEIGCPLNGLLSPQAIIDSAWFLFGKSHPERLFKEGISIYFSTWGKQGSIDSEISSSSSSFGLGINIDKQWAPLSFPWETADSSSSGSGSSQLTGSPSGPIILGLKVREVGLGPNGQSVGLATFPPHSVPHDRSAGLEKHGGADNQAIGSNVLTQLLGLTGREDGSGPNMQGAGILFIFSSALGPPRWAHGPESE